MSPRLTGFLVLVALVAGCGPAPEPRGPERSSRRQQGPTEAMVEAAATQLDSVASGFVPWYFEAHPVRASALGVRDHAGRLPDLSRTAIQLRIDELLDWLAKLEEIRFDHLRGAPRYDFAVLEFAIRAELLDLEEARTWARDPQFYTATIATGIDAGARSSAPLDARMVALQSRLEAAPGLLEAARQNLSSPPRTWTELAVRDARDLISYLETDLTRIVAGETADPEPLPPPVDAARAQLVQSLDAFAGWLETDLLPRSTGDFRLGRYLFERKLLYEEHVSLSLEALERLNQNAIEEYHRWVEQVAAEIDPARAPQEILDSIMRVHPAPAELIEAARERMQRTHAWVVESGVVMLPEQDPPEVRESPDYARARFAWLLRPGPFAESFAGAAYVLTNARADWSEAEQDEYLTYFNFPELVSVTLNHTYPGEYVQAGYERAIENPLRRIFASRTLVEGWAHYAEQMAFDEGFAADEPAVRLMQLRRALQRHARWYAAVALHARGASIEDVVERFMEIAYAEELPARRQVLRATYDPMALSPALGRMQIVELRQDVREQAEEAEEVFELATFHRQILELGLPLPLARDALIPVEPESLSRRRP